MSAPAVFEHRMSEIYQGASPNARLLAGAVPDSGTSWQSYGQRAAGSVLTHVAVLLACVYILTRVTQPSPPALTHETPPDITWLKLPGPGGGGGGGGNKMPEPPRKIEIVPPKPRSIEPPKIVEVAKITPPQMNIPAVTAPVELPGAVTQVAEPTAALGAGTLGGAGPARARARVWDRVLAEEPAAGFTARATA
jgi:hypothetical protein